MEMMCVFCEVGTEFLNIILDELQASKGYLPQQSGNYMYHLLQY
jgi:hypothetical protein